MGVRAQFLQQRGRIVERIHTLFEHDQVERAVDSANRIDTVERAASSARRPRWCGIAVAPSITISAHGARPRW